MTSTETDRLFTRRDVGVIASYAQLEGAPSIDQVIADLDEKGRLSNSLTPPRKELS